jgi:hypothetical protein
MFVDYLLSTIWLFTGTDDFVMAKTEQTCRWRLSLSPHGITNVAAVNMS